MEGPTVWESGPATLWDILRWTLCTGEPKIHPCTSVQTIPSHPWPFLCYSFLLSVSQPTKPALATSCWILSTLIVTNSYISLSHSYFYWSQNGLGIYRVELNAVQDQTTSCTSGIPQGTLIINDPQIVTFTIESSLYYVGNSSCSGINIGLSSTSLNIRRTVTVVRISGQAVSMASFSEVVFVAFNGAVIVGVYNTDVTSNCPIQGGRALVLPSAPEPVQMMRAFRSVKQPLPGSWLAMLFIHTCIRLTNVCT